MHARGGLVLHWCADCAGVRAFETPDCADHLECPELACIECGTAVLLGSLLDGDHAYAVDASSTSTAAAPATSAAPAAPPAPWHLPRSA